MKTNKKSIIFSAESITLTSLALDVIKSKVSPESTIVGRKFSVVAPHRVAGYQCRGWAGPAVSVLSYNRLASEVTSLG